MKYMNYIVVRIKDQVTVLFEEDFIDNNQYKTQNLIIEVLKRLYNEKDFSVELYTRQIKKSNEDK